MSNDTAVLDAAMEADAPQHRSAAAPILSGCFDVADRNLPVWFRAQQEESWRLFEAIPMPARKEQAWRFSNVEALDLSSYVRSSPVPEDEHGDLIARSHGLTEVAARVVFANEQLTLHQLASDQLRTRGVVLQPLETAMVEHSDLFRRHFMVQPAALGSAKFAALHRALVSSGTFLYVPRGVEIDLPIEIFHWLHGENASVFPHMLLVAEEGSRVTVIEHFRSFDRGQRGFACGVNDLVVGKGAKVTYVCAQNWGENVRALQMNVTTVARDGAGTSLNLHLGGAYSRFESMSRLEGEAARSDLLAVSVADGQQEFDARTLQDHACPHTTSDLLYKNALNGRARSIFGGLIRVEPHAHFTDAYQTVRNLLLSDDAEANSMPGLEILADNVKCSHGATSGQIHEDELFYLLARGIPERVAHQLLVAGFLEEVIERLRHPAIASYLHDLIEAKFAGRR